MESTPITFDQLPAFVVDLGRKVDYLTSLLCSQSERNNPVSDRWLTIEELSDYLPGKPAITTLYGKVQRREIPFTRNGKRLTFRQSEIDVWMQGGRVKTTLELAEQASQYRQSTGRRKAGKAA